MSNDGAGTPWNPPGFDPPASPTPPPPSSAAPPPPPPPSLPSGPPIAPTSPPVAPPALYPTDGPPQPGRSAPEMSFGDADEPRPRRSRLAVGGAVVGVVALGAAGVFAAGQLGSDNDGGADSPEAVGLEMMVAFEQEDVLGMVDLLLPGEREVFREPLIDMVSELTRLEILSDDASLGDLAGLDVEMEDEAVIVETTNVDDIANITMLASVSASLDGDELPIGDFVSDLIGDGFDPSDLDQPRTTEPFELPMTVVENDGRWYLSVFYTAAEAARAELGEPVPAVGLEPRGGTTPEGAVDAMLDGVEQLDLGKFIAAINPNEAEALHRYAPLFLDEIQPELDSIGLDWQVTQSEYDVTGSGSKRFVTVSSLRIDGTFEGSTFFAELGGACAVIGVDGERFDSCQLSAEQGQEPTAIDDFLGGGIDLGELSTAFDDAFADYSPPGITVREVDGEWFVSPIGAGFDQFLALLGALDRDELDNLIDSTTSFVDDVATEFGDLLDTGSLGDDMFVDDLPVAPGEDDVPIVPGEDTDTDTDFDTDVDTNFDDEWEAEFEAELAIAEECYTLDDVEAVIGCLTDAVESGALPDYYLSVELRFPECGVAEQSLGRTPLYEMSDEAYTTTLLAASECFTALIASGALEDWEVPAEYLRPECAEGKNPWNFDLPEEFFETWIDCVYS